MKNFLSAIALVMFFSQLSFADLTGDTVNVNFNGNTAGTLSGTTVVGPGVELSRPNDNYLGIIFALGIDLDANSIELTVSKTIPSGNFTAIFNSLSVSGIDSTVVGVSFDAANSSAFDAGDQPLITFTPDSISLLTPTTFSSANDSGDNFTRTFIWDVEFESVPEPTGILLPLAFVGSLFMPRSRRLA